MDDDAIGDERRTCALAAVFHYKPHVEIGTLPDLVIGHGAVEDQGDDGAVLERGFCQAFYGFFIATLVWWVLAATLASLYAADETGEPAQPAPPANA